MRIIQVKTNKRKKTEEQIEALAHQKWIDDFISIESLWI